MGITGRDVCQEHDAGIANNRDKHSHSTANGDVAENGIIEVADLEFGSCKLQVQVPEKGPYAKPSDLIGKNIGTSFVHLTEQFFASLESEAGLHSKTKEVDYVLKTKVIELSGSVEAACALGVADGIVDLVGAFSIVLNSLSSNRLQNQVRQ